MVEAILHNVATAILISGALYWTGALPVSAALRGRASGPPLLLPLATGLMFWSAAGLLLAQVNCFTDAALVLLGGLWCAGWLVALRVRGITLRRKLRRYLEDWGLLALLLMLVFSLPGRGEWLLGGWDPGNYINYGISIGRTGGFASQVATGHAQLAQAGLLHLTARDFNGLIEAFPGIPVDADAGVYRFYFYRLTPVLTALLYRCGGLACALRLPLVMGMFSLLALTGMLWRYARFFVFPVVGLLLVQPIWLYHLRVPGSEMTELVLLLLLGMVALNDRVPLERSLLFFAAGLAVINRVSFLFYGALLLGMLVLLDLRCGARGRMMRRHAALAGGLLVGMGYVWLFNADALVKLRHIFPRLAWGAWTLMAVALLVDAVALSAGRRRVLQRMAWLGLRWGALLLPLLALLVYPFRGASLHGAEFFRNASAMGDYLGWIVLAVGAAGFGLLLFGRITRRRSAMVAWLAYLLTCTLLTLSYKHTAELYPWATKRFLVYTVPLVCLCAGWALLQAARTVRRRGVAAWVPLLLLLLLLVGSNARRTAGAWTPTDFNGMSDRLAGVAEQLPEKALLLSDHFAWGVPLQFCFGVDVINGERVVHRSEAEELRNFLRQTAQKRPVFCLVSTPEDASIFGMRAAEFEAVWSSAPLEFMETGHHATTRDFWFIRQRVVFRLYRLLGEAHDGK